jgi:hypothetical protein
MAGPGRPKKVNLELEAQKFIEQKKPESVYKSLTARRYYIAAITSGLLARSTGMITLEDLRVEAEKIADYLLENET